MTGTAPCTQATSTLSGGSTFSFDAFDAASADAIEQSGTTATDELSSNNVGLILSAATLLVGLLGAAAADLGHQPATEGVLVKRLAVAALVLLVSACGYDATEIPEPVAVPPATPSPAAPAPACGDATRSSPPEEASTSWSTARAVKKIRSRRRLIAGRLGRHVPDGLPRSADR